MTIIRNDARLGGQAYPLLDGADWHIESTDIDNKEAVAWIRTPEIKPHLRWVRQDRIEDLYTDTPLPLELSMIKGGFVLSKRLSRVMRPYFFWTFGEPVIRYDATLDHKIWDGAGQIRRGYLQQLLHHLPAHKEAVLRHRLLKAGRVEFTVLSERGEDKGHALIVDDLDCDLRLPCDTKVEVKLTDGRTFVGVSPIFSHDQLWMDIQSLINLHPFVDNEHLMRWLNDEGDRRLEAIKSGDLDLDEEDITNIDPDEAYQWEVMDYLASGGKAMWFASIAKRLANQHLVKIRARALERLKMPIPGGRYYVFVDEVGGREVPEGRILLDPKTATAWVSRKDWVKLSQIWGGADQDDALCILPFRDTHSNLKVLAWRQPNQPGEYAILEPVEDIPWTEWPELDERLLPTCILERNHEYEYDAPAQTFPALPYTIQGMDRSIQAAQDNVGMPGMFINLLMALQATDGSLPKRLAVRVEDLMDMVAKLGANTGNVKAWIYDFAYRHYNSNLSIPEALMRRVQGLVPKDMRGILKITENHWLDRLIVGIKLHINDFEKKRDELVKTAMPPVAVFEYGKDYILQAAPVRAAYSNVMRTVIEHGKSVPDWEIAEADFEKAWKATEAALLKFPTGKWQGIMAGLATRIYVMSEGTGVSDAVMWQPLVARATIEMLRDIGVIGDLVSTPHGTIAQYRKTADLTIGSPVTIKGTWFAATRATKEAKGLALPVEMGDVPKQERDAIKSATLAWAHRGEFNTVLEVRREGNRAWVYKNGKIIGLIEKGQEDRVGRLFQPIFATADDGNVLCVFKEHPDATKEAVPQG